MGHAQKQARTRCQVPGMIYHTYICLTGSPLFVDASGCCTSGLSPWSRGIADKLTTPPPNTHGSFLRYHRPHTYITSINTSSRIVYCNTGPCYVPGIYHRITHADRTIPYHRLPRRAGDPAQEASRYVTNPSSDNCCCCCYSHIN